MNTTPSASYGDVYGHAVPVSTAWSWHTADGDARAHAIEWALTDLRSLARSNTTRAKLYEGGSERQKAYADALVETSQIFAMLADRLPALLRSRDWNAARLERMPAPADPAGHAAWMLGDQALLAAECAEHLQASDGPGAQASRADTEFYTAVANALTTLAAAAPAVLAARGRGQRVVDLGVDPLPVLDATAVCGPLLTADRTGGSS